jgi:predicted RNA-binding protein YlxR (DUF448 family)
LTDTPPATGPTAGPKTHAEASRERRDAVSGEVMPEARLVRFVMGPDGTVIPDLSARLPGRGIWVEATRAAIDLAVKKNAFSRSAKTSLKPAADLADQVERLLKERLRSALGLARRSGDLTFGFEKARAAIEAGKAAWMVEASDGAADGRRKLLQATRRTEKPPKLFGAFTSQELSLALGAGPVIHLVFLAGRSANRWTLDVERLSGFSPLLPESWREGPGDGRSG